MRYTVQLSLDWPGGFTFIWMVYVLPVFVGVYATVVFLLPQVHVAVCRFRSMVPVFAVIFVVSVSAIRAAVVAMAVMSMAMAMVVSGFTAVTRWGVICVVLQLFLCGNSSAACGGLQLYL